ncbi:MAG: hypothetical protein IJZ07_01300 [Clostridia bacterium]|nr:hypothetical protein [Clostridia bacterium]
MEHLSVEEIIKYVTANKVDNETLDLLSKVNGHIRNCSSCKEKVNSFECINDEIKKAVLENNFDLNIIDDLIKTKKNVNKNY